MPTLNEIYWENRYLKGDTGWDMGSASTPLIEYTSQLKNLNLKILIPGCGNAHEAGMLLKQGFTDITLLDLAESPILQAAKTYQSAVSAGNLKLVHDDFFNHSEQYDLILEQTFFCAIHPTERDGYARKMHSLLKPDGKLAGLLFDFPLTTDGPPFGGSKESYLNHFGPFFKILTLEACHNSIKPREGRELFFILQKA